MKIEVGKFYRTKCGNKARIYSLEAGRKDNPHVHGARFANDQWVQDWWNLNGTKICAPDNEIVGEWIDPVTSNRNIAYKTKEGFVKLDDGGYFEIAGCTRVPWLDELQNETTDINVDIANAIRKFEKFKDLNRGWSVMHENFRELFDQALSQLKLANGEISIEEWREQNG